MAASGGVTNGSLVDELDDSACQSEPLRAIIDHTDQTGTVRVIINDAVLREPPPTNIDDADLRRPLPTIIDGEEEVVESDSGWDTSRRWSGELTLCYPWQSNNTMTTLGEDSISLWTESNEADFRDTMYHSGFKWRVAMVSSLAITLVAMVLVDPCLTMLGVLLSPLQLLLIASQIAAQRMQDRRRARQLGQGCIILLCLGFGLAAVPMGLFAASGDSPAWNGAQCTQKRLVTNMEGGTHPLHVLNLVVGPASVFVGVMVTFMTISTRSFLVVVVGFEVPCCAAYLLVALSLPAMTTVDGRSSSPVPAAVMAVVFMSGCFAGGATIGCMYVVLQRRAAIKSAEVSLTTT